MHLVAFCSQPANISAKTHVSAISLRGSLGEPFEEASVEDAGESDPGLRAGHLEIVPVPVLGLKDEGFHGVGVGRDVKERDVWEYVPIDGPPSVGADSDSHRSGSTSTWPQCVVRRISRGGK